MDAIHSWLRSGRRRGVEQPEPKPEQKGESLEVIELWSTRVPYQDLPEGILELRAALADDVVAAGRSTE